METVAPKKPMGEAMRAAYNAEESRNVLRKGAEPVKVPPLFDPMAEEPSFWDVHGHFPQTD